MPLPKLLSPTVLHFEKELGRVLTEEEMELLSQLAPRGLAKVNTDISRGIPAADTLCCLELARHLKRLRVSLLWSKLPREATELLYGLRRPVTAAELNLLARANQLSLSVELFRRQRQGELLEDILGELAEEFEFQQPHLEASSQTSLSGARVKVCPLSPTKVNEGLSLEALLSGMDLRFQQGKMVVTETPSACWFTEGAAEAPTPKSPALLAASSSLLQWWKGFKLSRLLNFSSHTKIGNSSSRVGSSGTSPSRSSLTSLPVSPTSPPKAASKAVHFSEPEVQQQQQQQQRSIAVSL